MVVPEATSTIRDTVIDGILALALLVLAWYSLKGIARRADPAGNGRAVRLFRWLDPRVQATRAWLASAPATFVYITTWTVTSLLVQGSPTALADMFAKSASTNIYGLLTQPLRVLFSSAFLVADNGLFLSGYIVVYVLISARLEQRIGTARWLLVALVAHVVGSIVTVVLESVLIAQDLLPKATALTTDVGVSYVMVGTCGGYLLFVSRRWRWWYYAALFAGVGLPLIVVHDIWSFGHFNATVLGLITTAVVRRWGVRPPLLWRQLVADARPRQLPTWRATVT
ncbi:MAG: hypothetical protein E6Q90_02835 [Actinobacteria bacterium]|nr:MAG: hypothetical protein E6Q90_02835 [Actinomycetota bacterium]